MLPINESHFRATKDHGALLADLQALAQGVVTGRVQGVPLAGLAALGTDLLNAAPGDFGALPLRWDGQATFEIGNSPAFLAFNGAVRVPFLIGAAIAGRTDLRPTFVEVRRFNAERGLQWAVFHGINEHRLWHGLTTRFVTELLAPAVETAIGKVPPLGALLLRERPDLRGRLVGRGRWSQAAFDAWLAEFGIKDHGLFWCLGKRPAGQWAGRDWSIGTPSPQGEEPGAPDATMARYLDPAFAWVRQRRAEWNAAGRLFPVIEMEAGGPAIRLVRQGQIAPSPRWLTFAGPRTELLTPSIAARESFVMVEFRTGDEGASAEQIRLSLNGAPMPTGLLTGNGTSVAIGWTGTIARKARGASNCDTLALDLGEGLGEGTANHTTELLRIWNF
ncbi:MAG: hypothetical protein JSR28_15020 [Proteobacteria bacterium]|nr:hypothetical protein [Pseudomonadota bacterium]